MRTLDNLYNFYLYILRKERGTWINPTVFASNLDFGQMDALGEYFAPYGQNQTLHDALLPLKKYQAFTSSSSGFVSYQADHIHRLGTPFTVFGSVVTNPTAVNEDELPFALSSQLREVTMAAPIWLELAETVANVVVKYLSFYPQQQQVGAYFYLRRPLAPVYAYTQVGRVITYDSANSVQLEFMEIYWNHILALALRYSGVNLDDEGIYKFAEQYSNETT